MAERLISSGPVAAESAAGSMAARIWREHRVDLAAVTVLLAAFPVVHNIPAWLSAPYWLDEAWVALSTRGAASDVPSLTVSTPIGFTLLLRLVPDPEALRLVPIAFHVLAVVLAYTWGRLFRTGATPGSVVVGFSCGAAVLLFPAQQLRHDLKQYSADAAVMLLFLVLTTWIDRQWSRRRLAVLTATVPVALLVSHVASIGAAASFGALLVVAAARRDRAALRDAAVAGAVGVALVAPIYLLWIAPNRSDAIVDFWEAYFPSVGALPGHVARGLAGVPGVGAVVAVGFVVLVVATSRPLVRAGRPRTLTALILMAAIATVLGVARIYPLMDLRTSHYLFVTGAAFTGLAAGLGALWATGRLVRWVEPRWHPLVAGVLVLAAAGLYVTAQSQWYRIEGNSVSEDVRSQVAYVRTNLGPSDVVVVDYAAQYGVAFYWDREPIRVLPAPNVIGWRPELNRAPFVVVRDQSRPSISEALEQATRAAGPSARIWVIRSHFLVEPWDEALRPYEVQVVPVGVEPVLLVRRR